MGVDGMDPNLTKKFVEEGIMPNVKKFLERGVAREDLVMQGGHPTITPPMWTTMATGTCPGTHGITCFWNPDPENLEDFLTPPLLAPPLMPAETPLVSSSSATSTSVSTQPAPLETCIRGL